MKSKQTKRIEALARLDKTIQRLESQLIDIKRLEKNWKRPVLKHDSTAAERAAFALLPTENPHTSHIKLIEKHILRAEKDRTHLRNVISNNKTNVSYV